MMILENLLIFSPFFLYYVSCATFILVLGGPTHRLIPVSPVLPRLFSALVLFFLLFFEQHVAFSIYWTCTIV